MYVFPFYSISSHFRGVAEITRLPTYSHDLDYNSIHSEKYRRKNVTNVLVYRHSCPPLLSELINTGKHLGLLNLRYVDINIKLLP